MSKITLLALEPEDFAETYVLVNCKPSIVDFDKSVLQVLFKALPVENEDLFHKDGSVDWRKAGNHSARLEARDIQGNQDKTVGSFILGSNRGLTGQGLQSPWEPRHDLLDWPYFSHGHKVGIYLRNKFA